MFQGSSRFGFLANDTLWSELVPDEGEPHLQFQWAHWSSSSSSSSSLIMIIVRREDDAVITIYVLWLHLIFVTIIPVALLVWLNRIIYRKLSEAMIFLMMMMLAIYMYMHIYVEENIRMYMYAYCVLLKLCLDFFKPITTLRLKVADCLKEKNLK